MDNDLNLGNYLLYLDIIMQKLNKFFKNQNEYIFCHQGCSKCCQHAQFPYTEIEFKLLMEGYKLLKPEYKSYVNQKINKIMLDKKEHKKNTPNQKFRYECPFLINHECSVYNFRGIVCRAFGLMTFDLKDKHSPKVPFCAYEGLNYSNVLDRANDKISDEMFKKLNLKEEPTVYNADYYTLIDDEIAQNFDFKFGKSKPLIEWFENSNEIIN